jgi:ribonuclease Y
VILSCYDPLRREIARLTIERLIQDGRIHPARIEEIAEKVKKDLDLAMKEEGEKAAFDLGIHNMHPEIIKLIGRLKYRTSYGQNVLMHSREVAYFAGIMAAECGVDQKLARRAGLLHDLGKAIDHEVEGTHPQIGGDLAKKYGENPKVINTIMTHHGDGEPNCVESVLWQPRTHSLRAGPACGGRPSRATSSGLNSSSRQPIPSREWRSPMPSRQGARSGSS